MKLWKYKYKRKINNILFWYMKKFHVHIPELKNPNNVVDKTIKKYFAKTCNNNIFYVPLVPNF